MGPVPRSLIRRPLVVPVRPPPRARPIPPRWLVCHCRPRQRAARRQAAGRSAQVPAVLDRRPSSAPWRGAEEKACPRARSRWPGQGRRPRAARRLAARRLAVDREMRTETSSAVVARRPTRPATMHRARRSASRSVRPPRPPSLRHLHLAVTSDPKPRERRAQSAAVAAAPPAGPASRPVRSRRGQRWPRRPPRRAPPVRPLAGCVRCPETRPGQSLPRRSPPRRSRPARMMSAAGSRDPGGKAAGRPHRRHRGGRSGPHRGRKT